MVEEWKNYADECLSDADEDEPAGTVNNRHPHVSLELPKAPNMMPLLPKYCLQPKRVMIDRDIWHNRRESSGRL